MEGIEPPLMVLETIALPLYYTEIKELGVILPENRSPIRLWDSRVNPRLMLRIVKRRPRLVLAESQGVEPCQPYKGLYTLAGWCLTVRPTLQMLYYIVIFLFTRLSPLLSMPIT